MTDETITEAPARGRRGRGGAGGGADARRLARSKPQVMQMPAIQRKLKEFEVLDDEALAIIENNADKVLEEIGIGFKDYPRALDLWEKAGAKVDRTEERVRFPRGMLRELLKTAPSTYTQHARNPARSVPIGGKSTVFAPVYGPPFVSDMEGGRRYATIEDFNNFVKMAYANPYMHHSGGTVCEPCDIAVNKRHLDMIYAHIKYSDKPFMGSVTAPERAQDTIDMCNLVFGEEFVQQNTVLTSLINCNSPMTLDGTMLGALDVYAQNNQACIVSPFILAGAMSPVTVTGTLTQVLCEVLAGAAFAQLVRPGAPIIFGTFAANISMQTGAPTFGTPEPALVLYGAAQLARRTGLPFRSGGALCGSKVPDAQAAYESNATIIPAVMGGVNFMLHAAGWLEGGLVSSYEKFVMDCDQLGMMHSFAKGIDTSPEAQALDAIAEVGPGGHFLGCDHTQNNFKTAFYRSEVADNGSFEQWEIEGSRDTYQRANTMWKKTLADYEAPELDPGIDESLRDFVAQKKAAVPDSFT
jgi:trimethylamine--corrinoid protein Co-methyltransferase